MQTARCPVCGSDVVIEDEAYEGDMETCSNCETDLEILSLHPPQVAKINDKENDGNDDMANDE